MNRIMFDSLTKKHRRTELVQDNLVALREQCVHATSWSYPIQTSDGKLKTDFVSHTMSFCHDLQQSSLPLFLCLYISIGNQQYQQAIENDDVDMTCSSFPTSLFHMKVTASVTKSLHEDDCLSYLHLLFFLHINSPLLLENKKVVVITVFYSKLDCTPLFNDIYQETNLA